MKTASEIRLDFQKTLRCVERLEDTARKLRSLGEEVGAGIFQPGSFWEGEAASQWRRGGEGLKEDMQKSAEELDHTASALREKAERIYEAEMRAYRLARERIYQVERRETRWH